MNPYSEEGSKKTRQTIIVAKANRAVARKVEGGSYGWQTSAIQQCGSTTNRGTSRGEDAVRGGEVRAPCAKGERRRCNYQLELRIPGQMKKGQKLTGGGTTD